MHPYYDAIYLSPHLDDAALSCGGQIAQRTGQGERVLIVSVMAGDPTAVSDFARLLHDRWELVADTVAARRAEDRAASAALGADWLHLDVPDCIYRTSASGEALYASEAALFGPVDAGEMARLVPQLADQFAGLPSAGTIVAPLTVGNHVDHQIVRAAAERTYGRSLFFYEDYPYMRIPGARDLVIPPGAVGWQARVIPLTAVDIQAKVASIAAFASQVDTFFKDRADLAQQIHAFADEAGGERIWWLETAV